jgi:hypothetical protein
VNVCNLSLSFGISEMGLLELPSHSVCRAKSALVSAFCIYLQGTEVLSAACC